MSNLLYHCGRCGSLFKSELGHDEERICGVCYQKPHTGLWPLHPGEKWDTGREQVSAFENRGEALDESGHRSVRKKRSKNHILHVVVVWTFLMGLAVWWHNHYIGKYRDIQNRKSVKANMAEGTLADERIALLSSALPQCHKALAGFLTAGTPEGRNQFVAAPIATAGRMASFYASNPFPNVDLKRLRRLLQEPVKVGDEWMIETRWQEGEDGSAFDAVFCRESGVWMLDWNHFARYGDYPWALFLAGGGPDEGEFRLLARKVSSGDEAEQGGARLRIVLLSPVFGKPLETGLSSPEFVIARRSDDGLLLSAAFDANHDGKHLFGSPMKPMEPEGLIRVRVRVKRGEFGGKRSFEIGKVIACHWIESDVKGFDLIKLKGNLFGGN